MIIIRGMQWSRNSIKKRKILQSEFMYSKCVQFLPESRLHLRETINSLILIIYLKIKMIRFMQVLHKLADKKSCH